MRRSQRLSAVLRRGGFSLHASIGRRLGVGFTAQCCIIAGVAIALVVAGAIIDHSLFLPGRSAGLLEHPGIWAFFGLQVALPISLRHSLQELLKARKSLQAVGALDGKASAQIAGPLARYLNLENAGSRLVAAALYGFGLG